LRQFSDGEQKLPIMSCVLLAAIGSQDKNLTLKTNEMAMQDSHSDIESLESYLGEVVGTKVEAFQIDTRRQDGCTAHLITLDYFVDIRRPPIKSAHTLVVKLCKCKASHLCLKSSTKE